MYAATQNVLLLIDVIFPGWFPFAYLGDVIDVPGYIKAHDIVLSYNFQTFIGGHVSRLGTRADVQLQQQYISNLHSAAKQAYSTTPFPTVISIDPWITFNAYLNAANQACVNIMLGQGWTSILGGDTVYLPSHCTVMIDAVRLDSREAFN